MSNLQDCRLTRIVVLERISEFLVMMRRWKPFPVFLRDSSKELVELESIFRIQRPNSYAQLASGRCTLWSHASLLQWQTVFRSVFDPALYVTAAHQFGDLEGLALMVSQGEHRYDVGVRTQPKLKFPPGARIDRQLNRVCSDGESSTRPGPDNIQFEFDA